jgi:hypothetical protein
MQFTGPFDFELFRFNARDTDFGDAVPELSLQLRWEDEQTARAMLLLRAMSGTVLA